MELEEMQAAWSQMSSELEKQKQLTDEIILKMIQEKHTSRWNRYARFEFIGAIVCYAALIFIIINFSKLDTLALQVCGILMIVFLLLLPIFSIKFIKEMSALNIDGHNNVQMMRDYVKKKKNFVIFQKTNMVLSFFFMLLTIPVSAKLLNDENLFITLDKKLLFAIPACTIFFIVLIYLGYRGNRSVLRSTDKLLEEVKETR